MKRSTGISNALPRTSRAAEGFDGDVNAREGNLKEKRRCQSFMMKELAKRLRRNFVLMDMGYAGGCTFRTLRPVAGVSRAIKIFNPYNIVADAAAHEDRQRAYNEMKRTICDAWKHPPARPASDPQMARNRTNPQHSVASMADASDREAAYKEYVAQLNDAWRGTAK
jgi:hypothetical protein